MHVEILARCSAATTVHAPTCRALTGGEGGLGIQRGAWGGRGGGCVGSFIRLLFLLTWQWDCAVSLVWDWWVGGGGGGFLPKDVGVLAVAALWEGSTGDYDRCFEH